MPLEWGKDGGSLLWVRNPFTGAVTYFTDVHKKRSGFPPPLAVMQANDPEPRPGASLDEIRRNCPFCPGNEAMTTAELLRVAPSEVEAALVHHPDVAEVAVVGVPDAQWGEIVCAVVMPRAGAAPTLAELQRHCEGRLAGFKKPRRLELVRALPRTAATGQIQRALLVQQLLAKATA